MSDQELVSANACDIVDGLHKGEYKPEQLLQALEQHISRTEPEIFALPTLCFERAYQNAKAFEADFQSLNSPLAGLPIPIKDLTTVEGVRTTFGSKLHENFIPDQSNWLVEHLEAMGGVVYAKSNTPEFGAGGNSFNYVFETTRNPYDTALTAGGSSGGAAAAVATGMAWVAHGSDLAGSLRTPASFCGICSLRPSPYKIFSGPSLTPFQSHPQEGAMARSVEDVALLSDAMISDGSIHWQDVDGIPMGTMRRAARAPEKPQKIAFSLDLGIANITPKVADLFEKAITRVEAEGIESEHTHPDLSKALEGFRVQRALGYAANLGDQLDDIKEIVKPELRWNIELGLKLNNKAILKGTRAQGLTHQNAIEFMKNFDLLICPAVSTQPFPIQERYVGYQDGKPWSAYLDWLEIASLISATTLPVITLPCGKDNRGLPFAIQLIGKPNGEEKLFSYARYLEEIFGLDGKPKFLYQ